MDERFTTTSNLAFGNVPKPDPPPPIGSRKELTQTNWKMGDRRSEDNARHGSTFKEDFPVMHGEPGKQMRTKKQLTQTNWVGGDARDQTWTRTNALPKCDPSQPLRNRCARTVCLANGTADTFRPVVTASYQSRRPRSAEGSV